MTYLYVLKFLYYARYFTLSCATYFTTVYLYKNFFAKSANVTIITIKNFLCKNMTLATCFTLCRLWLAIPICNAIILRSWHYAFCYTILAGFTDFFDGFIARYYNQETSFGAFLDAFVDKLLMGSVIWILLQTIEMPIPFKIIGLFIIFKEALQVICSLYLCAKGALVTVRPLLWGKASMCGQLFFVLFLLLNKDQCGYAVLYVGAPVFMVIFASAVSYGALFTKLIK